MKNENIFSKNGFYSFIVDHNILLHEEAKVCGTKIVGQWLAQTKKEGTLKVLDLACGGKPVIIAHIMSQFPQILFEYDGIDINPDQVQSALNEFQFPKNVVQSRLIEGNAWDFDGLQLELKYDLVFSGLNIHHAIPEEIYYLAKQLKDVLKTDGLFINHDIYRPEQIKYLRRPDINPNTQKDDMNLVSKQKLQSISIPDFQIETEVYRKNVTDWREDFIQIEQQIFSKLNAPKSEVGTAMEHLRERDFSVSIAEMQKIFKVAGFSLNSHQYSDSNNPLKKYFYMIETIIK